MEDPSSQNLLLQFVLLFILTVLNAFFSATEMAMVSLNRARVEQKAFNTVKINNKTNCSNKF